MFLGGLWAVFYWCLLKRDRVSISYFTKSKKLWTARAQRLVLDLRQAPASR